MTFIPIKMTTKLSFCVAIAALVIGIDNRTCAAAQTSKSNTTMSQTDQAKTQVRPLPLHRFQWSRSAQQDRDGYFRQVVALCDDYPEESRNEAKVKSDFETMRKTGVTMLRFGIAWESVEREQGKYNWQFWDMLVAMAARNHITLLPYVCYTPQWLAEKPENFWRQAPRDPAKFAEFVFTIASRYKGKIHSWELWNEPDNHEFWEGTVAQYAEMVKEGALAVRRADPKAIVILGGQASTFPTDFFRTLKMKFAIENYIDVVNIHSYHETWSPDVIERYPSHLKAMSEIIQNPEGTPDLWLAEFGYSNYRFAPNTVTQWGVPVYFAYEHTAEYQATALLKTHLLALSTGTLSLTAWYRINDLKPAQTVIGDDNNKFLGILDVAGKPKPAFYALRFYNRLFDQAVRCVDSNVVLEKPNDSQSEIHCFEKANGNLVVTAWLRSARQNEVPDKTGTAVDTRHETVTVSYPHHSFDCMITYRANGEREASPAQLRSDTLRRIPLSGGTIFIAELIPAAPLQA